ncbi:unnamed protein product [Thlaspi arvense]|uniref:Uncharacterized protein n=1 Tax=Thlaspi arvense TaxID=13288 RepID=A0AAU9R7C1_THLAR|nr:unnamed protein product [Thlaspi arvense]
MCEKNQNGTHSRAAWLLIVSRLFIAKQTHQSSPLKKKIRFFSALSRRCSLSALSPAFSPVSLLRLSDPSGIGVCTQKKKPVLGCANEHYSQMLFAAEGGGFFSSSASGYSNGLALLLLGQKNEQKPVRVSPWNHYHLVAVEADTKFELASSKNWISRGCTSLICFGGKAEKQEDPSPIRVNPSDSSVHREGKKDDAPSAEYNCEVTNRFALKSSLKKRSFSDVVVADADDVSRDGVFDHTDRRKVQWPDTCGIEIAEVREFEPSEVDESDDEFHHGSGKSCMCTIM